MKRQLLSCAACVVALGAVACGGGNAEVKKTPQNAAMLSELEGAPAWVVKGCVNYYGNRKDVLCGVGGVSGTRNIPLAREAAVARGRTEVARSLQVVVESMLKDYQATSTGGEAFGQAANDEQMIENVARQITDISINGTRMDEIWVSPNGTLYALVSVDLEGFKGAVQKMSQLDEGVRRAVEQRAEHAFQELDAKLQKKN